MKKHYLFYLLPVLFLLNGCDGVSDSADIRTSGLYADINVSSQTADSSLVSVRLRVGDRHSNDYLNLTNGDRLQAILNDSFVKDINVKAGSSYQGRFNVTGAGNENTSYRVSFIRPNDTDATNSTVIMPLGLTSFSSTPVAAFSRSMDVLTLSWDATAENRIVPVTIKGDCFQNKTVNVNSSVGVFAINPMTLVSNSTPEQNCPATITANVTNTGNVDIAYGEGGVMTATRTTSFSIMSTP